VWAVMLAVVVAGCGTGSDRDQARLAAQRLYAAVQDRDGTTACAQMSPDLRDTLVEDEGGGSCARAVLRLRLHQGAPSAVHVFADEAQVRLTGGDTVFLSDSAEGWRADAVGCRPKGPGPYECEEEV
jgi:hypothetical protein